MYMSAVSYSICDVGRFVEFLTVQDFCVHDTGAGKYVTFQLDYDN